MCSPLAYSKVFFFFLMHFPNQLLQQKSAKLEQPPLLQVMRYWSASAPRRLSSSRSWSDAIPRQTGPASASLNTRWAQSCSRYLPCRKVTLWLVEGKAGSARTATCLPGDSKSNVPKPDTQNLAARCHREGGNAGRPARCWETEKGKLICITQGDQPLQPLLKKESCHWPQPH